MRNDDWWRSAVIYQIYPRSFADSDGDGVGDLPGITARLDALADLGVDAVWLSPFMTSPQKDAGYDVADYCDVDPIFGTLADADALIARAHDLGMRIVVDLVPNHSSSAHPWFQEALAAGPGSPERDRYLFRPGKGEFGELPPNNWQSVFGGPAWTRITEADGTPGPWYLHLFDSSQPDFDWTNPWVHERFREILRFWLDRGVDGFRVDVAHGLVKAEGLPDYTPGETGDMGGTDAPYWGQDGVHEIYRDWHRVLREYGDDRALIAEAWVLPLSRMARWVRADEMQQSFNFGYLETSWNAAELRRVIVDSLEAFGAVGAPSTWVLSNHDVIRHTSRLSVIPRPPHGQGIGQRSVHPDDAVGLRRGRAATALMLALPGSAYVYQGEELGLPEVVDLPDAARQDPTFARTAGESYGRDGCRVPIPWEAAAPAAGFSPSGESWLPQPGFWPAYARDVQRGVPGSTLEFYRATIAARRELGLATGEIEWVEAPADVVAFRSRGVTVWANTGVAPVALPAGEVLVASGPVGDGVLPGDTTVWLR